MSQATPHQIIEPEGVAPAANYVHAIRAGNTLYVAGQVARDESGNVVAPDNAAEQAKVVMTNLERILRAAGGDWGHVVKMTTYLVDRADSPAVAKVRLGAMGGHRPPHTGMVVAGLGSPDFKLEIEMIAVLPE